MTEKDRNFLSSVCARLEDQFPGLTAGFEGFRKSYLGGECDGFFVVEVFDVPDDKIEDILTAGEAMAREHLLKGGIFVTFNLWDPEETLESFLEDVEALKQSRRGWCPGGPEDPPFEPTVDLGEWLPVYEPRTATDLLARRAA